MGRTVFHGICRISTCTGLNRTLHFIIQIAIKSQSTQGKNFFNVRDSLNKEET